MDRAQASVILTGAIDTLFQSDAYLLEHGVDERALSSALAGYLKEQVGLIGIRNVSVDAEYNRNAMLGSPRHPKALWVPDGNGAYIQKNVRPDVIVHERGQHRRNLLVIEIKKNASEAQRADDFDKLRAFTETTPRNSYHYLHGAFVNLRWVGQPAREIIWFSEGHRE
jgi:hypothetical protein